MVDEVIIQVKAGNGGDGAATFLRNALTAKGGPNGGNGGNGGNVFLLGSHNISDLQTFRYKKKWSAEDGIKGAHNNLFGRNGEDLIIEVPLGSRITNIVTQETMDITKPNEKVLVAIGGKGGRGNNEFKSAQNQTPTYKEFGEKGEEKEFKIELLLIAEIGLIGLPNAGKSSLLESLTNASPKVGAYPFTTLEPNLGVMDNIILADIPGLIEGASQGKGLGTKFLKHIKRTKFLLHCIESVNENPLETYNTVRKEFEEYGSEISEKPEIVLITKSDLVSPEKLEEIKEKLKSIKKEILHVSIYNFEELKELEKSLKKFLAKHTTVTQINTVDSL